MEAVGGGGCGCRRRWLKKGGEGGGGGGGGGEGWERPGFRAQAEAAELSWGCGSTEEKRGDVPGARGRLQRRGLGSFCLAALSALQPERTTPVTTATHLPAAGRDLSCGVRPIV